MIKFVLGLIALIFVTLAVYVYTDKQGKEITKSVVTHKMVKKEVTTTKVSKPVTVAKEVSTFVNPKDLLVKDISSNENQLTNSQENEIGKGLTLEGIENADVSEEVKKRLLDDMIYNHSTDMEQRPSLNNEELEKIIIEDLEKGLL